jgi:hypothetical protein
MNRLSKEKNKSRWIFKKYASSLVILSVLVLFILFRLYIIDRLWDERVIPPEPDDSFGYIARIRIIGDTGSFFYDLKYILLWNRNDNLAFLPWSTNLAIVKILGDFSYFDVYKANFYFGTVMLAFIILYMLTVLEQDKLFWILAFLFLTLYNGSGYYHGFFWVVPSFYSVAATFLLISLIFDIQNISNISERKRFVLILIITFLTLWSHPLGKFSYFAIQLSFMIYILLNAYFHFSNSTTFLLKRAVTTTVIGFSAIFSLEVLPYWMGIVPYTYPSIGQLIQTVSNAYDSFEKLYLSSFNFFNYNMILLFIGLFATLVNKKIAIFSIYTGFLTVSLACSLFNKLGYRMLMYLWPLTLIVYSYGCCSFLRRLINAWKNDSGQKIIIKVKRNGQLDVLTLAKDFILYSLVATLIIINYVYPFVRENYDYNLRFIGSFSSHMSDWIVDRSIVDYLKNTTKPGDLIIFSDTNAFLTVTSLGLLDREVAYANWNWSTDYAFLRNKVNGSYLVATRLPYRREILNSSLSEDVLNLRKAFEDRLSLSLVRNFGILSIYQIIVKESEVPFFIYDGVSTELIADDFQTGFWSKTQNVLLEDNNKMKISGNDALKITLSQSESGQNDFIWHTYESLQDWSQKDLFIFYWYGSGSGKTIEIIIYAPDVSNRFHYAFTDSSKQWNLVIIPLKSFAVISGKPSWSKVKTIYFRFTRDSPYIDTFCLDRLFLDVSLEENEVNEALVTNDFLIFSKILLYFYMLFFPPGFILAFFLFRIRRLVPLIASSFGLSFSVIFLSLFLLNLAAGLTVSTSSIVYIIFILTVFPIIFNCFRRLLKMGL